MPTPFDCRDDTATQMMSLQQHYILGKAGVVTSFPHEQMHIMMKVTDMPDYYRFINAVASEVSRRVSQHEIFFWWYLLSLQDVSVLSQSRVVTVNRCPNT